VNALDENIPDDQRRILFNWRMRFREIGRDIGRFGMQDDEIIALLHQLGPVTFFTLDLDYFRHHFCHTRYCLVHLDVNENEAATFIRRFLRHPAFNTEAKRMGKIIRTDHTKLHVWRLHAQEQERLFWPAL